MLVLNSGALGGSGRVGGAVTVQTGGTIFGGDPSSSSNNALTLGNGLTTQSGSTIGVRLLTLTPDLSSTNPASNSFLNITGGTTTIDSGTNFLIDGSSLSFNSSTTYIYRLATGAGDQSSLLINNPARFSHINFTNPGDFIFSVSGTLGGDIFLNIAPVPEPGMLLGVAMAGLAGMSWLRRKIRRRVDS